MPWRAWITDEAAYKSTFHWKLNEKIFKVANWPKSQPFQCLEAGAPSVPLLGVTVPIYIGIQRWLGLLRGELGRRRRFGRGRAGFWFVGGLTTGEESLDHVKSYRDEENGNA